MCWMGELAYGWPVALSKTAGRGGKAKWKIREDTGEGAWGGITGQGGHGRGRPTA
jgi:hypothetical protein